MPTTTDLDDTANLPILEDPVRILRSNVAAGNRPAATGRHSGPRAAASSTGRQPYAAGIIRFYRARTIIDDHQRHYRKAWQYLDPLSPFDVPRSARREFIELVYFMQQQDAAELFDAEAFARRVHSIAGLIDDFVDALTAKTGD